MKHSVSQSLRIAMVGASGATGRLVVGRALDRGHRVVALVRSPVFSATPGLTEALWPEISDPAPVISALDGVDVVISTIGGATRGPTTVCTVAMASTVTAMREADVSRVIAVSAHGVLDSRDRSLYSRAVWSTVGERMKDKETMEPIITSSGAQWTIVRPPALSNGRETGSFAVGEDLPIRLWHRISRADLADFLVTEAESGAFVGRYPRLHQ